MENTKYKISIDKKVLKLLGAHLYGDTPSVINELIANSHDARAKNVYLTIQTEKPYKIIIQDDGIGMTDYDINQYFLNVGYNRRENIPLQNNLSEIELREDLGQKGIGKLAVFSLSNNVDVISKKNGKFYGCSMDFRKICDLNEDPQEISNPAEILNENNINIDNFKPNGTVIILNQVTKNLSKSLRYIKSSVVRSFVLNNQIMKVHFRANTDDFKEIKRSELNYFSELDVLLSIGLDETYINIFNNNKIEDKYKKLINYNELARSFPLKYPIMPINLNIYNNTKEHEISMEFKFTGWIGTVKDVKSFNNISRKENPNINLDTKDSESIVADDNRISIYSRGKVGEYNILSKIKSRAANDAYIIGEIFVDDFEKNGYVDMATSNRRGYQEDDPRYETLITILKTIVSRVILEKSKINKLRSDDELAKESQEIKDKFISGMHESKQIFDKMNSDDKITIQNDFEQYTRAVSIDYSSKFDKNILISHRTDTKEYGDLLIKILTKVQPDLKKRIIFTSDPYYSVPKGRDIFDELKKCFRPDYLVIFLFSKSFYDSNPCLAEAGAAWATNTSYFNFVIDIRHDDIDKPINRNIAGSSFIFNDHNDIVDFSSSVKAIFDLLSNPVELVEIVKAVEEEVTLFSKFKRKYKYLPTRKFHYSPICEKCNIKMTLQYRNDEVIYECQNQCGNILKANII